METNIKRTKIVATIGPASEGKEILDKIINAGVNVARLNFSHGSYSHHALLMSRIREASKNNNNPVAIMQDLQGPRVRVGDIGDSGLKAEKGETVFLVSDSVRLNKSDFVKLGIARRASGKIIPITYPRLAKTIKKDHEIYIDDKLIELIAKKAGRKFVECSVKKGGVILKGKGVNFPNSKVDLPTITEKDKRDLEFGIAQNVDFAALSFVRSEKDIEKLKRLLKGNNIKIVSKIERPEAIKNFDKILKASDAIMVARGDLGIEMPEAKIAILQKEIINKCLRAGKPVIVATQMLNSMIENPNPTRAEVSDVSNAVIDHTDAVMLSGETASGKYPVETVEMMSKIILETEKSPFGELSHGFLGDKSSSLSVSLADSAHELAKNSKAKAIVVASMSGFTARMIARHRPEMRIIVMTNSRKTHLQMSLIWGVESYVLPDVDDLDDLIDNAVKEIKSRKLLNIGDKIVILTGRPHIKKEHMSLVKVEEIK